MVSEELCLSEGGTVSEGGISFICGIWAIVP